MSDKVKEAIYPNKRQKVTETPEIKKTPEPEKETPQVEAPEEQQPLPVSKSSEDILAVNLNVQVSQIDSKVKVKDIKSQSNVSGQCVEESKEVTYTQMSKKDTFNFKRYKPSPNFERHKQVVRRVALNNPEQLVSMYVFVYLKKKDYWQRAIVCKYIPSAAQKDQSERRMFVCKLFTKHQEPRKETIDFLKTMFVLDLRFGETTAQPLKTEVKPEQASIKQSIQKIMSYPLYNNKKRVEKLLSKSHQSEMPVPNKINLSQQKLSEANPSQLTVEPDPMVVAPPTQEPVKQEEDQPMTEDPPEQQEAPPENTPASVHSSQ